MPEINDLFERALTDEPAPTLRAADVAALGRRRARRRRAAGLASAACVTGAGVAIVASVAAGGDPQAGHVPAAAGTSTAPRPATPTDTWSGERWEPARPTTITPSSLPRMVERDLQVQLRYVSSEQLGGDIDLGAGIVSVDGHRARSQYLNVQVMSRHNLITDPTCARLSGNGPNGDGYTGPCEIRHLAHGSLLVLRTGHTAHGRYRITSATLFRTDGSGITAEATNQAMPRKPMPKVGEPVVSAQPPVSAEQLSDLVLTLAKSRVSS